jgi:hypothetical protein
VSEFELAGFKTCSATLTVDVFAGDARYDVRCQAFGGDRATKQSFVRAANPNQILGVELRVVSCGEGEATRVLLNVDASGTAAVSSTASLWKGQLGCE